MINALWRQWPELAVTLRSGYSRELLAQWLEGPFVHRPVSDDFALVMHDAVSVNVAASPARYRELHAQWDERVEAVAAELEAAAPDLVLADIPYLTRAAARRLGVRAGEPVVLVAVPRSAGFGGRGWYQAWIRHIR